MYKFEVVYVAEGPKMGGPPKKSLVPNRPKKSRVPHRPMKSLVPPRPIKSLVPPRPKKSLVPHRSKKSLVPHRAQPLPVSPTNKGVMIMNAGRGNVCLIPSHTSLIHQPPSLSPQQLTLATIRPQASVRCVVTGIANARQAHIANAGLALGAQKICGEVSCFVFRKTEC